MENSKHLTSSIKLYLCCLNQRFLINPIPFAFPIHLGHQRVFNILLQLENPSLIYKLHHSLHHSCQPLFIENPLPRLETIQTSCGYLFYSLFTLSSTLQMPTETSHSRQLLAPSRNPSSSLWLLATLIFLINLSNYFCSMPQSNLALSTAYFASHIKLNSIRHEIFH